MSLTLPHRFHDNAGEPASGQQVDENFDAVVAAVEGIGGAAAGADLYQAGIVVAGDWSSSAQSINSGTGVLSETAGGAAWLPGPSGGLVRTFTAPAPYTVKPPLLPGPGGYVCVGLELTAAGASAVVSAVCGTEQSSEGEALAHSPAVSSGKMRKGDAVVKNTAGVYSLLGTGRDRRPWALGATVRQSSTETFSRVTAGTNELTATGVTAHRVEVGANGLLAVFFSAQEWRVTTSAKINVVVDGVPKALLLAGGTGVFPGPCAVAYVAAAQGSHLVTWSHTAGGESFVVAPAMQVVEQLRPSADNGIT